MNGTTAAVVMGAVVIAGAAAAVVWAMKSGAPAVGQQIDKTTGQLTAAIQQTNATNAAIATQVSGSLNKATGIVAGISNAAKTVGDIVNTGKRLLDGAATLFKGFKLF